MQFGAGACTKVKHIRTDVVVFHNRSRVCWTVRRGNLRLQLVCIKAMVFEIRIMISLPWFDWIALRSMVLKPFHGGSVRCNQSGLGSEFGAHVAEGHAFLHG